MRPAQFLRLGRGAESLDKTFADDWVSPTEGADSKVVSSGRSHGLACGFSGLYRMIITLVAVVQLSRAVAGSNTITIPAYSVNTYDDGAFVAASRPSA